MQSLIAWVMDNPFLLLLALFVAYRVISQNGPFPEGGGRVVSVKDEDTWDSILAHGAEKKRLVVADFYATWCPPCRSAAPVFGKLSTEFLGCDFVKVDVDNAQKVARREQIKAMPTFKVYENNTCVATIQGFDKLALVTALKSRGAVRTAEDSSLDSSSNQHGNKRSSTDDTKSS